MNSVHPGLIDTPILHVDGVQEAIQEMKNAIPLKRIAKPEEVSNLLYTLPQTNLPIQQVVNL